jgi:hypothetical protein
VGKRSRTKGARGEREVVAILRAVWEGAKRGLAQTRAGNDCADVEGATIWPEVKIGARPNIHAAMAQATEATDGRPPVAFTRRDGEGWLVTMKSEHWIDMVAAAKRAGWGAHD